MEYMNNVSDTLRQDYYMDILIDLNAFIRGLYFDIAMENTYSGSATVDKSLL
jgi:hypothetical protein